MARLRKLTIGVKGLDVTRLQAQLTKIGFSTPVTGDFTPQTRAAVMMAQRRFKMESTGVAGYEFQEKLNVLCPEVEEGKFMSRPPPREEVSVPIKVATTEQSVSPRLYIPRPMPEEKVITEPPYFTRQQSVIVVTVGNKEHVTRLAAHLSEVISCNWALFAATTEPVETRPEGTMRLTNFVQTHTDDPVKQWAEILEMASHHVDQWPFIMPCVDDGSTNARTYKLLTGLLASDAQVAFGSWFDTGLNEPVEATRNAVLEGRVNISACLIRTSLLADGLDVSYGQDAFNELFLRWQMRGVRFAFITGSTVYNGTMPKSPTWGEVRDQIISRLWHRPKISALLLTGKCQERYSLARVAVECFFNQTWPNKELVVINHGSLSLLDGLPQSKASFIHEVRFNRPEDMTIGDMRNLSMDVATGEWMIQWDDDDWHHPLRMETQFAKGEPEVLNTLGWQVRCNIETGAAFYDMMPGGQHMSVLYARTDHRYEKLNAREDTRFFESFKKISVIDNAPDNAPIDPMLYVRFFHGRNIWDQKHIMGGSDQRHNDQSYEMELNTYHKGRMLQVLESYAESTKRLNLELSLSGHKEWHATDFGCQRGELTELCPQNGPGL